jgi:hypothetical protein
VRDSDTGDAEVAGPLSDADRAEIAAEARRLYAALGRSWHGRIVWTRSPAGFEALAGYGARRELLTGRDRWRAWRRRALTVGRTVLGLCSLIALLAVYAALAVLVFGLASWGELVPHGLLERVGARELLRPLEPPHGFVVAAWLFGIGVAGSLLVRAAEFVEARGPLDRIRAAAEPDPPLPRRRRLFRTTPRTVVVRSTGTPLASGPELTPRMVGQAPVLFGPDWSARPLVLLPRRGTARRRQQAVESSRALRRRVFACAPFRRVVVILEPPTTVRSTTTGSPAWRPGRHLHNADGPALEWADGERHHYLNGCLEMNPPAAGRPERPDDPGDSRV